MKLTFGARLPIDPQLADGGRAAIKESCSDPVPVLGTLGKTQILCIVNAG
jgi:hypothetical protein